MQFRTQIPILKSDLPIDYDSKMVSLGSCFAVNIAQKFSHFKFENVVNPYGILFHPLAIEKFIRFAVEEKQFSQADMLFNNERWHCPDAHSELSDSDEKALVGKLNSITKASRSDLNNCTHIIITLGTAWVYRFVATGETVANCHKLPQKQFQKQILDISDIKQSLENIVALIRKINPEAAIIFTISPVRHIKDGFSENQWSKANLISALNQFLATSPLARRGHYFPSYEIMMDELRDYRFYAEDMLHPSELAIDYIWKRFSEVWISGKVVPTMNDIDAIQKSLSHRPFDENSHSHAEFKSKLSAKISAIKNQYPHIEF